MSIGLAITLDRNSISRRFPMSFINLTPHAIVLVGGPTLTPSGVVARCATTSTPAGEHEGVPLVRTVYGVVEGLPEHSAGVVYVVSALVRSAVPSRNDVASPGDLVRDAAGAVVGCKGLVIN
ncbi:MAG: hypothetical protein WCK05_10420 [Planctomycetota bacterium]